MLSFDKRSESNEAKTGEITCDNGMDFVIVVVVVFVLYAKQKQVKRKINKDKSDTSTRTLKHLHTNNKYCLFSFFFLYIIQAIYFSIFLLRKKIFLYSLLLYLCATIFRAFNLILLFFNSLN